MPLTDHVKSRFATHSAVLSRWGRAEISSLRGLFPALPFRKKTQLEWTSEVRGGDGTKDFLVLVFGHYQGWKATSIKEDGSTEDQSLQLNAVLNDVGALLRYFKYKHGDTSRRWYFVMDSEVSFTDANGVKKTLPRATVPGKGPVSFTKEGILQVLREASRDGGSGFIHCGVHCIYALPGTSVLTEEARGIIDYREISDGSSSEKTAYILDIQGNRIDGAEFYGSISGALKEGSLGQLTLSFDMCHAQGFFDNVINLRGVNSSIANTVPVDPSTEKTIYWSQLVVIYASRVGQFGGTLENRKGGAGPFGAMTILMIEYLEENPTASAAEFVAHANSVCQGRPEARLRQSPGIMSRYPLTGRFSLLPDFPPTL